MPAFSLVIPAHNESVVLPRLLRPLRETAQQQGVDVAVVVVANGCTDDTAAVAREAWPEATVVETQTPGKANALNLGDAALDKAGCDRGNGGGGGPRFYVDADVQVDLDALLAVTAALDEPGTLAAAPRMHVDLADRPWSVRAFYRVWTQLPYALAGMIGSGVYGLSAQGRARFDRFPAITADDAFVRLQFKPGERKTLGDCHFTITPPKTLGKIIAIKTRSHFGNLELRQTHPELWANEDVDHGRGLRQMATNPINWPAIAVYLYVKLASRRRAEKRLRLGQADVWERDDSSREAVAARPTPGP